MLGFNIFVKIIVVLGVIILIGGMTMSAKAEEQPILLEMKPATDTIIAGGPCILHFAFTNTTTSKIGVNVGTYKDDRPPGFYFEILDEKGKRIAKNFETIYRRGGIKGVKTVPPEKSTEVKLILNQWCSTLHSPGKYTIVSYYDLSELVYPGKYIGVDKFKPTTSTIRSECQIEILPVNKEKLQETFSKLLTDVFTRSLPTKQRLFAVKALACNSPFAIPYLTEIISTDKLKGYETVIKPKAIKGLGRIGTVEAAKELVALVKGEKDVDLTSLLKTKAIIALFKLSDTSKDPKVIKACKPIVTTMPRPKEPRVFD